MARNRMIKPEFWSSDPLMKVSRDSRLIFIGIWNFCDDYGFCLNSNRSLLGDIFPYDETVTETKLRTWINELIEQKLLIPVDYKTKKLLFVKGWGEHQTVQHKSKRAHVDLDDLEQVIKDSLKSHEDLIKAYLDAHAPKRKKKVKEKEESNKEKGTLERQLQFKEDVEAKWKQLGAEGYMPRSDAYSFYNWWSESNADGEMKCEKMEFFEIGKRLSSWKGKIKSTPTNPNVRRNA